MGTWTSQTEPKWSQTTDFFWMQKSYEFIAKHFVRQGSYQCHYCSKYRFRLFSQKTVFFETQRFALTGTSFLRFIGSFFHDFCMFFYTFFVCQICMQNMTMCSFTYKMQTFCFIFSASLSWKNMKIIKKGDQNWHNMKPLFLVAFSRMLTASTRELDFRGFFLAKTIAKSTSFFGYFAT